MFSKFNLNEGIRAGLWESAVLFTQKMFGKIHEVDAPKNIINATSIGAPSRQGQSEYIDIIIDLEQAPAARAFELGSGIHSDSGETYEIHPKNVSHLAFMWDKVDASTPPGRKFRGISNETGKAIFTYVDHPGVKSRPYIKPTMKDTKDEIVKIIGTQFTFSMKTHKVEIIE